MAWDAKRLTEEAGGELVGMARVRGKIDLLKDTYSVGGTLGVVDDELGIFDVLQDVVDPCLIVAADRGWEHLTWPDGPRHAMRLVSVVDPFGVSQGVDNSGMREVERFQ